MEDNFDFDVPVQTPSEEAPQSNGGSKDFAGSIMDKIKALPKTVIIGIGAVIALILVIALCSSLFGNSYKTPIKTMEKQLNSKKYVAPDKQVLNQLNGFCSKEVKKIFKIMKKSGDYKDELKDAKEDFKDYIDEQKDELGSNYKYKLKITDKDKIDKDDLKDVRDMLHDAGDELEDLAKEAKDWDKDDWEDFADAMDISKAQAKKLVKAYGKLGKKLSKAKVQAGYELEVEQKLTGKELDDPIETDRTITVYKVNGRWISESALYTLMSLD